MSTTTTHTSTPSSSQLSYTTILSILVLCCTLFYVLLQKYRPFVYDFLIVKMTSEWYRAVLEKLPPNSIILDVGIGTGSALFAHEELLRSKHITIIGVDYDLDYVRLCQENIRQRNLQPHVSVYHQSIYDFQPPEKTPLFDAIYFSGSLMIMPDPTRALQHVKSMLKPTPGGKIYVTQTFEEKKNLVMELMKPLLKFLTTIDFGQVTYASEFFASFERAGLRVVDDVVISSGATSHTGRSVRLVIGE